MAIKRERLESPKPKKVNKRSRLIDQGAKKYQRRAGEPTFEPTEDQRRYVAKLTAFGASHVEIASCIINPYHQAPIDTKTLKKHFAEELKFGLFQANMAVSESLYKLATGRRKIPLKTKNKDGEVEFKTVEVEADADMSAILWWEKSRRGLKEGVVLETPDLRDANKATQINQTVVFMIPHNGRDPLPQGYKVIEGTRPADTGAPAVPVKVQQIEAPAKKEKPKARVSFNLPDNNRDR